VELRRDFHKYPEVGWTEFRTAAKVTEFLQRLDCAVVLGEAAVRPDEMMGVPAPASLEQHQQRAIAQGADPEIVAQMTGGLTGLWTDMKFGDGPLVALRFDLDANDLQEAQTDGHRPWRDGFASVNDGAMHACGHDGHAAVGLVLAKMLVQERQRFSGTVRLIFQPSEEGVRGAKAMVAAGAVDGVDTILGFHLGFQAGRPGLVIAGTEDFLATTKLNVWYKGQPAHAGAYPEQGKNALLAACTATLNLHAIARHSGGATRITVGKLHSGQGRNVIPADAYFELETRGVTSELDEYMLGEARRIIQAAGQMWDVSCRIEVAGGTKSGKSSPELAAQVADISRGVTGVSEVALTSSFGASEDYSHFMSVVQQQGGQGTYLQVGAALTSGHHTSTFDFDEAALSTAAEILLRTVWALLGINETPGR